MEVWKKCADCDWLEVSNFSNVRVIERIRTGTRKDGKLSVQRRRAQPLTPWMQTTGYWVVSTKNGPVTKKYFVHRLVARAFVPGYSEGLSVNHIDGNKLNNGPENLEWITLADNTRHQWATGLINLRGERHPSSKLTNADVIAIKLEISKGRKIIDIANEFGVSDALIYKVRANRKLAHV
jgi:hypothetical protein